MNCHAIPDLLHAYVDSELDVAHTLEVEQHMQGCSECARVCAEIRTLRAALGSGLLRYPPPDALRTRIRAALPSHPREGRPRPLRSARPA